MGKIDKKIAFADWNIAHKILEKIFTDILHALSPLKKVPSPASAVLKFSEKALGISQKVLQVSEKALRISAYCGSAVKSMSVISS